MTEDFDKTLEAIEAICDVIEDVDKALDDDKITWTEGAGIVVKNGVKSVKAISNFKEIAKELKDIDSDEATEAVEIVLARFGDSDEVKEAIKKIAKGSALMYEGTKALIELRKD